jgi:curved DNA-binding protein CbpA
MSYDQYYEFLKQQNGGTMYGVNLNIEATGLNPYEILGVRKRFTWDELKNAYRVKAKMVHPDKGGTQELFNLVTDAFRMLASEYKMRVEGKSHAELKVESQQAATPPQAVTTRQLRSEGESDEEFYKRFNRMFEENRLEDDESAVGYGHVMAQSSAKREDINVPQVMKKYSRDKFNAAFDKSVPLSKDVIVYKEPQALTLAKTMAYTELGGKTDDFSSSVERGEKRGLVYSDYMRAHTTSRLVDPRAVKERKEYKNVDEYESARANAITRGATEEEQRWMEERQLQEEQREQERLNRLRERDVAIAKHHERVNGLLMR